MTTPGRYSGKTKRQERPRQAENEAKVRITGPHHVVEHLRRAVELAADTMPGWQIARTSRLLPADQSAHVRRYVDLEVAAPTPSGRYRYPRVEVPDADA
ncbi:hypothetical protein ACQEVF_25080 [Nonomuraea polychroma]|uniref:hypothetical protein n=1 Tax=Nonomuraea polychroma TaxID=46176 RepID=UPI003D9504EB